jgi:hypothetical protein
VTISSYLLILYAVLQVIGMIVALSMLGKTQDVYRDLYAGTSAEGTEAIATVAGVGGAIIGLLFAVGFVVLALLNNRGKNVSRIVTWSVGGVAVCCAGLGLAGSALTGSMGSSSTGDAPSPAEIQRRLDEVLPSWYGPVTITVSVLGLLALLAALVLLALPPSNAFFRKPQATSWEPPMPGSTYPGYPQATPAYPSADPGYPPPAYPSADPAYPQAPSPAYPSADPGYPSSTPPAPPAQSSGPPAESAGSPPPSAAQPATPPAQPSGPPAQSEDSPPPPAPPAS